MTIKIATNIETTVWKKIIETLITKNWKITDEYPELYDKSVDNDFYRLEKNGEVIEFGWTNWLDGEIKAKQIIIEDLKKDFDFELRFDKPHFFN